MGFSLMWAGKIFTWELEGADGSSMSFEVYHHRPKNMAQVLKGITHRAESHWRSTRRGLAIRILPSNDIKRRILPEEDVACCRLPCTYSIYGSDGRFIGESKELVCSPARLRDLSLCFGDSLRMMMMLSQSDGRFNELSKLVHNEAELHNPG